MRSFILFLSFMLTGHQVLFAQPILAGDDCSTATVLTPGTQCSMVNYTHIGASSSTGVPNPTCGSYTGGDVWLKTTVPSSGKLEIDFETAFNYSWQVYSGTCGSLNSVYCRTGDGSFTLNNPLTAGQDFYIRVFRALNFQTGNFNICAWEPATPSNDSCIQAQALSVGSSCNVDTFANYGCTSNPAEASNPTCGAYAGYDIWFKAQVPASGKLRFESVGLNGFINSLEFLTGSCGSFTKLKCITLNEDAYNIHNPALAGQWIYVRVYSYGGSPATGRFTLCAWEPNTPANDFCANAIPIPVGSTCTMINSNNEGCTPEPTSISPNPSCGAYQGTDQWYTLQMPASGHLRLERQSSYYSGMTLYSGTCGAMTELACASLTLNFININNQNLANQTLYLRIYTYGSSSEAINYSICAWEPNTPSNDSCSNAQLLNVPVLCNYDTFTTQGATRDPLSTAANPTCGGFTGADVWFKCTMPMSGLLGIGVQNIGLMQPQFAVYSGSCGSFTQLNCSQFQSGYILNNVALAGQLIYLRVWDYGVPDGEDFTLCLYEPNCLVTIDSIQITPSSCSSTPDAGLTVHATCYYCTGSLQYALDNGAYQSSPVFSGVNSGFHSVKVRDQLNTSCQAQLYPVNVTTSLFANYYYPDADQDGYGTFTGSVHTCYPPSGYVTQAGDCNDADSTIHPGKPEIPCNSTDENCNGNFDDTPSEIALESKCNPITDNSLVPSPTGHNGTNFFAGTVMETRTNQMTIKNLDFMPLIVNAISISGADATDFSWSGLTLPLSIAPNSSASFDLHFTPSGIGVKQAVVTIFNNDCDEYEFNYTVQGEGVGTSFMQLNLKAFVEGYYTGNETQTTTLLNQGIQTCPDISDSIEVQLRDPINFTTVYSSSCLMYTDGSIPCRMAQLNGFYYLVVKHRNAIETWSASPVQVQAPITNYAFHSGSAQAYGQNMPQLEPGVFGLFSGDINQDGVIDGLDYNDWEVDNNSFGSGYLATDLNGDGIVDGLDFLLWEINNNSFIGSVTP